jgi:HPt (histidine-containing phosphotransfer) domain-containing protein
MLEYLAKGSGAPLSRQIERYVSALQGALAELESIVMAADLAGTESKAHSVLGMARYVDAHELAGLANAISEAAREGNLPELPRLLSKIRIAAGQIVDELNRDGRTT